MLTLDLDKKLESSLLEIARKERQTPSQIIAQLLDDYIKSRQASDLLADIAQELPVIEAFSDKDPLASNKRCVMSGAKFLLDTNILIGLLNHNLAVSHLLATRRVNINECAYSAITRMELLSYHGLKEEDRNIINHLLNRMQHFPINLEIEEATIAFRQRQKGKLLDAIIAATAIQHQLERLTLDMALSSKLAAYHGAGGGL